MAIDLLGTSIPVGVTKEVRKDGRLEVQRTFTDLRTGKSLGECTSVEIRNGDSGIQIS